MANGTEQAKKDILVSFEIPRADQDAITRYLNNLVDGKYAEDKYWRPIDDRIYHLTRPFYKGTFGKTDIDKIGAVIKRLYLMLINQPETVKDIFNRDKFVGNYLNGGWTLKLAAWVAVHSYATCCWINGDIIRTIMPTMFDDLHSKWNEYVSSMTDIPDNIKAHFIYSVNGWCEFAVGDIDDMDIFSGIDDTGIPTEFDHPTDDEPEDPTNGGTIIDLDPQSIVEVKSEPVHKKAKQASEMVFKDASETVSAIAKDIINKCENIEKNVEEWKQRKDAKKEEPAKKEDASSSVVEVQPEEEHKEKEITPEVKTDKSYTFSDLVSPIKFEKKDGEEEDNTSDPLATYYKQWEEQYVGLNKFTKVAHDCGYYVNYRQAQHYPGLIQMDLFDPNMFLQDQNAAWVKSFFIDPCVMYGDGIRFISNIRKDGNMYKEAFIRKSQTDLVAKCINGTFTDEDYSAWNNKNPRFMINVLRKVDLHILRGNINNIVWKNLIGTISKAIRDVPECRFRLENYKSATNFNLVCDDKVKFSFDDGITKSKEHIEESEHKLWICVNGPELTFGHMDGTDVTFNPLKNWPKPKVRASEDLRDVKTGEPKKKDKEEGETV